MYDTIVGSKRVAFRLDRLTAQTCLVLGALLATGSIGRSQACWTETAVTSSADGATAVFAADVDGDGDQDVLSASRDDDKIAWYENTSGGGSPLVEHVISTNADGAMDVFAADMDGDGDTDVLSASLADNKAAWYENTIGDGSTWIEHVIPTSLPGPCHLVAADVDGDGDLDAIVSACDYQNEELTWHENVAGDGSAWIEHSIPSASNHFLGELCTSDMDGDGDTDILATRSIGGLNATVFVWYENTAGDGSLWTEHQIDSAGGFRGVSTADVDGDGDMDCLAGRSNNLQSMGTAWWENTIGDGSTWTRHAITLPTATALFPADVDRDGDIDVWSALEDQVPISGSPVIVWHENFTGSGDLWIEHPIATKPTCCSGQFSALFAADMDGDGDLDPLSVFATFGADGEIAWYENENAPCASSTYRNAGSNPYSFIATPPLVGGTFSAEVYPAVTTGHNFAGIMGFLAPLNVTLAGGQTLLVNIADPSGELLAQPLMPGPIATFSLPVSNDPSLPGLSIFTQAFHLGGVTPFALSNAQDLVIGVK